MKLSKLALLVSAPFCLVATNALGQQNTTSNFTYDTSGRLATATDPLNQRKTISYDALGRISEVKTNEIPTERYSYDQFDQVVKFTDPGNAVTATTFDGFGNVLSLNSPDSGQSTYTYDAAGNVLSKVDALNKRTTFTYDLINRVKTAQFQDGGVRTFEYDQGTNGVGRLTKISDVCCSLAYAYDRDGNIVIVTEIVNGQSFTTQLTYSSPGNVSAIVYPTGLKVVYEYDTHGRITGVTAQRTGSTPQTVVSSVTYQPFGRIAGFTFGNGQMYRRTFDLDGRVTSYSLGGATKSVAYDPSSRVIALTDNIVPTKNVQYDYDALGRIKSYISTTSASSFVFDPSGNLTQKTSGASATNYSYIQNSNRMSQIAGSINLSIVLDANGNTIDNGTNTFAYDSANQMTSAKTVIGDAKYVINPVGQRIRKVLPNSTTTYHYDLSGRLIAENVDGAATEYVYLGDMPVAVLN